MRSQRDVSICWGIKPFTLPELRRLLTGAGYIFEVFGRNIWIPSEISIQWRSTIFTIMPATKGRAFSFNPTRDVAGNVGTDLKQTNLRQWPRLNVRWRDCQVQSGSRGPKCDLMWWAAGPSFSTGNSDFERRGDWFCLIKARWPP